MNYQHALFSEIDCSLDKFITFIILSVAKLILITNFN